VPRRRSLNKELYLRIQDFDYELPQDRIAIQPAATRDAARLLTLDIPTGARQHASFRELPRLLRDGSLLVLNDTRVIPARLVGTKPTGGRVEIFLIRRTETESTAHISRFQESWEEMWVALLRGVGHISPGTILQLGGQLHATLIEKGERGSVRLLFRGTGSGGVLAHAEAQGQVPLPPYIEAARRRTGAEADPAEDRRRYQTVYARAPGAVAAPTAGLHFTEALLDELKRAGHELATLTLHVGPGTFRPVDVEDPRAHQLDPEHYEVSESTAAAVNRARAQGRPIVAVGTTVVRTLEALGAEGELRAGRGSTALYILPGHRFRVVTDLITNFHLPRSTLLMLVAAFAGQDAVMDAYREAVAQGYRFYSYGDAMFLRGPRAA
jgi:S-adenosylmethionine:tRNA ribosyltransferase-isomerase